MRASSWISLLAYEARVRHTADRDREQGTGKRLASRRSRVIADLRRAITLDIEGFLRTQGDRAGSELTCCNGSSAQGFVVSRTGSRVGTRSLAIDLDAGTLSCRYETAGTDVTRPADRRVLAVDIRNDGRALSLRNHGSDRTFATVDALSAFLLAPILADA